MKELLDNISNFCENCKNENSQCYEIIKKLKEVYESIVYNGVKGTFSKEINNYTFSLINLINNTDNEKFKKKLLNTIAIVIVGRDYLIIEKKENENEKIAIIDFPQLFRFYKDNNDKEAKRIIDYLCENAEKLLELKEILKIDKALLYELVKIDMDYKNNYVFLVKNENGVSINKVGQNNDGKYRYQIIDKNFEEINETLMHFIGAYLGLYKNLKWQNVCEDENGKIYIPSLRKQMECGKEKICINTIEQYVFLVKTYRGFVSAKEFVENLDICDRDIGFQRNIYKEHIENIKKFLKSNHSKYIPEITISLRLRNEKKYEKKYDKNIVKFIFDKNFFRVDCFKFRYDNKSKDEWKKRNFYIIDGRHRLRAIKEFFLENSEANDFMLPITFLEMDYEYDLTDLKAFYYINKKQKPLVQEDYHNLIATIYKEDKNLFNNLNDIVPPYLFGILKEEFDNTFSTLKEMSEENKNIFLIKLTEEIGEIIEKNDEYFDKVEFKMVFEIIDNIFFKDLKMCLNFKNNSSTISITFRDSKYKEIKFNKMKDELDNNLYKIYVIAFLTYLNLNKKEKINIKNVNIVKYCHTLSVNSVANIIENYEDNVEETKYYNFLLNLTYKIKEIIGAVDKNLHLFSKVKKALDIYEILKTFDLLKTFDVFISMKFEKDYEWVYYVVKDAISELERELKITINTIRLDKPTREYEKSYNIYKDIVSNIMETHIMIADISGESENVYHEIGMKTAIDYHNGFDEPRIIVLQDKKNYLKKIPFNIKNLQIEYYKSDVELKHIIKRRLKEYFYVKV